MNEMVQNTFLQSGPPPKPIKDKASRGSQEGHSDFCHELPKTPAHMWMFSQVMEGAGEEQCWQGVPAPPVQGEKAMQVNDRGEQQGASGTVPAGPFTVLYRN